MMPSDNAFVMQPFPAKALQSEAASQCYWRAAQIVIGLELDRAARGGYAERLSQVTGLAAEDLQDPFSGRTFVYRKTGHSYTVYSIGPDGKDNGGEGNAPANDGSTDLVLWGGQ